MTNISSNLEELGVHPSLPELLATEMLDGSSKTNIPRLLPNVLRVAAQECRDNIKLVSGKERFSYSQIDLCSDPLARRLIASGVQPGDRVVLGLPNSATLIIACFAIWKARAILVALDPCIRPVNLQGILQKIAPTALIADHAFAEKLQGIPDVLDSLRAFFLNDSCGGQSNLGQASAESLESALQTETEPGSFPEGAEPSDATTITFTSGSTSTPKGVVHTHESLLACSSFTRDFLQLSKADVVIVPLPLHHVLAFRRFLTCVLAQCTLVLAHDIFIMKQFSETRPTGLVLVPSACNFLIDNFSAFFRKHSGCLRYVEVGGESISPERLAALQGLLPSAQIHITYGLTEGRVGYLKPGPDGVFDRLESSNRGLEVKVLDGDGRPAARGQVGEILISGSGLFKGYWGDSNEAQDQIRTFGFRTGDMGVVDGYGNIELLGRMDDLVKVAGHKFSPHEIEAVLRKHPSVAEAVVIGVRKQENPESVLHAFVIPKKGAVVREAELMAFCRDRLELYKMPARIYWCTSFPKTAIGKIQRHLVAQSAEIRRDGLALVSGEGTSSQESAEQNHRS